MGGIRAFVLTGLVPVVLLTAGTSSRNPNDTSLLPRLLDLVGPTPCFAFDPAEPAELTVTVVDEQGKPIRDVNVEFKLASYRGAARQPVKAVTDADGVARLTTTQQDESRPHIVGAGQVQQGRPVGQDRFRDNVPRRAGADEDRHAPGGDDDHSPARDDSARRTGPASCRRAVPDHIQSWGLAHIGFTRGSQRQRGSSL